MNQEKIRMFREMFGNDCDILWITNEKWKVQDEKYSGGAENLPALLELPEDFWGSTEKIIFWNERFYHCRIWCSKKAKCRVITLKKIEHDASRNVEVNSAVHSLRQIRQKLEEYMQEKKQPEEIRLLDSIERNCLLLYRKSYIDRILDAVQSNIALKKNFSVQDMLRQMQPQIIAELGNYAETEFRLTEKEMFLDENMEFFRVVVLAGLTLCHMEQGYFQQVAFSLGISNGKAELLINMTPDYQKPVSMTEQIDPQNFSSLEGEKNILHTFCQIHDGSWRLLKQEENKKLISACCQIQFQTTKRRIEPVLNSRDRIMRSDFDNPYKIMLARIYLSNF